MANKQDGNVGNHGDVAKHLAYVALCKLVSRTWPGQIVALDSHAYLMRAPRGHTALTGIDCPGGVAALLGIDAQDALDTYMTLQESVAPEYLCSPGIAARTLPSERTSFRFAEWDAATRARLQAQATGLADVRFADDAAQLASIVDRQGAAVALFDPFRCGVEDADLFRAVGMALGKATAPGAPGVLLAYRHDASGGQFLPLEAPGYERRPVAVWQGGQHRLAAYATTGCADAVATSLAHLGFRRPALLVGIDLAWSTGNTGVATLDTAWGGPVDIRLFATREEHGGRPVLHRELASHLDHTLKDANHALVAVDAPLRCRTGEAEGRAWELLFEAIGRRPQRTTWERFSASNGILLRTWLDARGFQDFALDATLPAATTTGLRYVEVYPNPAIRSFGGSEKYKRAEAVVAEALMRANLLRLADLLRPLGMVSEQIPPSMVGPQRMKEAEDRHDAVACLWVAALLAGALSAPPGAGLYLLGGHGKRLEEGCLAGPFTLSDAEGLAAADTHRALVLPLDRPPAIEERPTLSDEQRAVAECDAPIVAVVARAGTGKTTVVIERAGLILQRDPAARVMLLTFSRAAATEMSQRFARRFPHLRERLEARTFHGLAVSRLSTQQHPRILLEEIGREAFLDWFEKHPEGWFGQAGGRAEDMRRWPDELTGHVNKTDPGDRPPELHLAAAPPPWPRLFQRIVELQRAEGLLDFDTALIEFADALRTDPGFRVEARCGATHVIVDEVQDTNWPQLRALQRLTGYGMPGDTPVRQLVVVGDDFQSIYGFRGAIPGVFSEIRRWHPDAALLHLTLSQRSLAAVLEVANRVADQLAHLPEHRAQLGTVGPRLVAKRAGQGETGTMPEAELARRLRDWQSRQTKVRLLAFRNATLDSLVDSLRGQGLDVAQIAARPADIPGLRLMVACFTLACDEQRTALPALWDLARAAQWTPRGFEGLRNHLKDATVFDRTAAIGQLGPVGAAWHRLVRSEPTLEIGDCERALRTYLLDVLGGKPEDRDRLVAIARAIDSAPKSLGVVRALGEMTRSDLGSPGAKDALIVASTVHQSKGLEAPVVILIDDFITTPHKPAGGEKMRVDYVARTRARNELYAITDNDGVCEAFRTHAPPATQPLDPTSGMTAADRRIDPDTGDLWVRAHVYWVNQRTGESRRIQ